MTGPVSTKMSGREQEAPHLQYVDALRGFAFLSVLLVHASLSVGHFGGISVLYRGIYGVQLFFIISALTLCNSSAFRKGERYSVLAFYIRRCFRIMPLFVAATVFYWLWRGSIPWGPVRPPATHYVLTALCLHGWNPNSFNDVVPGGWSIAVEVTFYLIFPLLSWALESLNKACIALVISTTVATILIDVHAVGYIFPATRDEVLAFYEVYWFPSQLPVFILGIVVYHVARVERIKAWVAGGNNGAIGAVVCVCACLVLSTVNVRWVPTYLLVVMGIGVMVVFASGAKGWLVNPAICFIGKLSYSCYIVHFAVLEVVRRMLGIQLSAERPFYDGSSKVINLAICAAIVGVGLVATIGIATITLHLVEKPGIAWGRRLIKRMSSQNGQAGSQGKARRLALSGCLAARGKSRLSAGVRE